MTRIIMVALTRKMEVQLQIFTAFCLICAGLCTDLPRFSYKSKDCRLIHYSNVYNDWYAGCPNSIALLNEYGSYNQISLRIHIDTEGDIVSQLVSIHITCPSSTVPIKVRLLKDNTTTSTFCKAEKFPVELRHVASSRHVYQLILRKVYDADILNVFRDSLDTSIDVEAVTSSGKSVVLKSNLLHAYSIDRILSWKSSSNKHYMTSQANDFFGSMPYASAEEFPQLQFFDTEFVAQLHKAIRGTFFQNLLQVGGFMDFASDSCDVGSPSTTLLLLNRLSNINYKAVEEQIYYHLNLADGMLKFSRSGISVLAKSKANSFRSKLRSICMYVSFSTFSKQKQSIYKPYSFTRYSPNDYKGLSQKHKCAKASNADYEELTLFSGMPKYSLKCPIICDFDVSLEFKHGTKTLLTSRGFGGYQEVSQNFIIFPEHLEAADSGTYSCRYRDSSVDLQHTFNVSVVSLPYFQTKENPKLDGSLPPVIYAVEGESLSYSCTVFYYGLPVALAPEIFHSSVSHGWRGPMSESDYLFSGAMESTVKDDNSVGASTLTVRVKKVPSMDRSAMRNFTHRFHCKASVPETDKHLRILNMKDYTVVSGSNVIYIPKPTSSDIIASPDNKCFMEGCNSEAGASFSFKFSSNFAAYIRKIGVKVTGYFMLDDLNVASIPVIRPEYSTLNEVEDFELKLTIPSITEDLLYELQKRKTLTAVYNFNYNSNELLAGLQLEKSKYGKARVADDEDCRSDKFKTCFYSTSFPAFVNDSSLNFLTTDIYF